MDECTNIVIQQVGDNTGKKYFLACGISNFFTFPYTTRTKIAYIYYQKEGEGGGGGSEGKR